MCAATEITLPPVQTPPQSAQDPPDPKVVHRRIIEQDASSPITVPACGDGTLDG
jgi:hypothetical protein